MLVSDKSHLNNCLVMFTLMKWIDLIKTMMKYE